MASCTLSRATTPNPSSEEEGLITPATARNPPFEPKRKIQKERGPKPPFPYPSSDRSLDRRNRLRRCVAIGFMHLDQPAPDMALAIAIGEIDEQADEDGRASRRDRVGQYV